MITNERLERELEKTRNYILDAISATHASCFTIIVLITFHIIILNLSILNVKKEVLKLKTEMKIVVEKEEEKLHASNGAK